MADEFDRWSGPYNTGRLRKGKSRLPSGTGSLGRRTGRDMTRGTLRDHFEKEAARENEISNGRAEALERDRQRQNEHIFRWGRRPTQALLPGIEYHRHATFQTDVDLAQERAQREAEIEGVRQQANEAVFERERDMLEEHRHQQVEALLRLEERRGRR